MTIQLNNHNWKCYFDRFKIHCSAGSRFPRSNDEYAPRPERIDRYYNVVKVLLAEQEIDIYILNSTTAEFVDIILLLQYAVDTQRAETIMGYD